MTPAIEQVVRVLTQECRIPEPKARDYAEQLVDATSEEDTLEMSGAEIYEDYLLFVRYGGFGNG